MDASLDDLAITRLQAAYGDVVTRRAWDELPALFVPDCPITVDTRTVEPIELVGPVELGRFVDAAIERFRFFELAILNAVATIDPAGDGTTATGRMYIWELRQDEGGHRTDAYGLYRDDFVKLDDGGWRFARRRYSSMARTAPTVEVFDLP